MTPFERAFSIIRPRYLTALAVVVGSISACDSSSSESPGTNAGSPGVAGALGQAGVGGASTASAGSFSAGAGSSGASSGAPSGGASAGTSGSSGTSAAGAAGTASGGTAGGFAGAGGTAGMAGALTGGAGSPAMTVANVTYSKAAQVIDGFGTAIAWGAVPPDAAFDAFFSVTKGAGLSIVRNRIPFRESPANNDNFMGGGNYTYKTDGSGPNAYKTFTLDWNNWDLSAARALIAKLKANSDYAVSSYFSTPWTPPNNNTSRWKLGVADYVNKPEVGGHLDPAHYADYADVLADYVLGFETKMGAPLTALSLQNEPNYKVDYESADWSAAQFHDFLTVLKSEFNKKGVFTALPKLVLMAPEDPNFKEDLVLPSLADSNTSSLIGIVGVHQYEFGPSNSNSYMPAQLATSFAAGKKLWMTEWNTSAFGSLTPIQTGLVLARLIQQDFNTAHLNAYVHWWYKDLVGAGNVPNKNLWVLAQFSRFVRPGWSRVTAPATVNADVSLTAFKDPSSSKIAAVVLNRGKASLTFALMLDAANFGTVTAYRTSANEDMQSVGSVASSGHFVNVTVAPESVTTFVAPITN